MYWIIYGVVFVLTFIGIIIAIRMDEAYPGKIEEHHMGMALLISVTWPICIIFALPCGLFYGLLWLCNISIKPRHETERVILPKKPRRIKDKPVDIQPEFEESL